MESACASTILFGRARAAVKTVEFWEHSWGYVLWVFVGLLVVVAGLFQPIDDLGALFGWGAVVSVATGLFFLAGSGNGAGFFLGFGFAGFLLAMYAVGFAIASLLFGWVIIAFLAAALLYGFGVLGVLGL